MVRPGNKRSLSHRDSGIGQASWLPVQPTGSLCIERSRLDNLLQRALQRRLVFLVAPTGYGKTLALTHAISALPLPVFWFSPRRMDTALKDLRSTIISGLQAYVSEHHFLEQVQHGSGDPEARRILTLIHDTLPEGCLLVVDAIDRHGVAPKLRSVLQDFLDHGAPSFRLAITSEEDVGLHVMELARTRELAILTREQLAFTREEAAAYYTCAWRRTPDDRFVDEVMDVTRGWPRGISAIGSAIAPTADPLQSLRRSDLLSSFRPPDVTPRLSVLDEMDRQLLMAVAFLPTFTPLEVDRLVGVRGVGARLASLSETYPWLTLHSRDRYSMDSVVRVELLSAIQEEWSVERIRSHKKLVGLLLEERHETSLCLSLYLDASETKDVNRVLTRLGFQYFLNRDPSDFLSLARKLEPLPDLCAVGRMACALVADAVGEYEASQMQCREALRSDLGGQDEGLFLILKARAEARLGQKKQEAEAEFRALDRDISQMGSSVAHSYLAAELMREGAFEAAETRLRRSLARVDASALDYHTYLSSIRRAELQIRTGRYQTALGTLRKISGDIADQHSFLAMRYHYLFAELLGLRGEFADALSHATRAYELSITFGFDVPRHRALVLLADNAIWHGDLEGARTWFGEAESIRNQTLETDDAQQALETTRARLAWAAGAIERAKVAFKAASQLRPVNQSVRLWNHLSACHARLRIGEYESVTAELYQIVADAERADIPHVHANAHLLAGYAHFIEDASHASDEHLVKFWEAVDLHGFRFMPASDAQIVLWAERSRTDKPLRSGARAGRLIAPALPTPSPATAAVFAQADAPPLVEIDTFGPLTMTVRGEECDEVWKARRKAKRFLEILLCSDSQRTTADEAAEYLWPTASPERIRHSLHNEVSNLRKIFTELDVHGHVEVRYEHSFYCLYCSDQVRITHQVFQNLAERAQSLADEGDAKTAAKLFRDAAACYRGAFLKDAQYERFPDIIRQYLADLYAECLHALAKAAGADDTETLTWWEKAIEHDPFDEDAYQAAIEIAVRLGQKRKALKYLSMMKDKLVGELELVFPRWAKEVAEQLKEA